MKSKKETKEEMLNFLDILWQSLYLTYADRPDEEDKQIYKQIQKLIKEE